MCREGSRWRYPDVPRLLQMAAQSGPDRFAEVLHAHREEILRRAEELSVHIYPNKADVVLREYCPEINLEEQYNARLAELAACEVAHLDEQGRPSITAIDGNEYPIPTLEEIRERLTLEKIRLISALPEPRIMLLVPFGMSLKGLGGKVTMIPGNLVLAQDEICIYYDSDAGLPNRTNGQDKLFYDPKRFKPQDHGGKSKQEILKETN